MKNHLYIDAAQCTKCKAVVFSRARHDFRQCSCGAIAIDGGRDYVKLIYDDQSPKVFRLFLSRSIDIGMLFNDWNLREDKYGLVEMKADISPETHKYTLSKSGKISSRK